MGAPLFVICACGQKIPVHAGMAGSSIACVCGQNVAVPTLRILSQQADGVDPSASGINDPLVTLRVSLEHGQPPAGSTCIVCQCATENTIVCGYEGWQSGWEDPASPWITRWLRRLWGRSRPTPPLQDVHSIKIPVRICAACFRRAGDLKNGRVLRQVLAHSTLFRELAAVYPRATFKYQKTKASSTQP